MVGGQITLFLSQLPTVGPGKLTARDDPTTYNTDKEKALFATADPFWRTTAEELAECGVGANVFLFPEQYTDVASVGTISVVTGGETFFHPKFQPVRDRDTLHDEIKRTITRETVYNATVRIRCSNGLRAAEHVGGFYQRSLTDLEFGTIDDAKAFGAVLRHEGQRLDDRQPAYVQVAVLYTSSDGHRRVRCLNLSFGTTSLIGNVFRFADLDAAATLLVKEAVTQMPSKPLREIRRSLQDKTNRMLLMYRKHCAPAVQQGQVGGRFDAADASSFSRKDSSCSRCTPCACSSRSRSKVSAGLGRADPRRQRHVRRPGPLHARVPLRRSDSDHEPALPPVTRHTRPRRGRRVPRG
jgi:protein transport protein SEC24